MARKSAEKSPECPRCGYDLRGVVTTWAESCPLEGVCAECGLLYRWAEVMRPEKFEPLWCVEFARRGVRSIALACGATFGRSFLPWKFWSRMRMSQTIRWSRLRVYVLAMLLPLLLMYIVLQSSVAVYVRYKASGNDDVVAQVQWQITTAQNDLKAPWLQQLDPQMRTSIINQRNAAIQLLQGQLTALQTTPRTVSVNYWQAVGEALLQPWSDSSSGTITDPVFGATPYVAPRDLYAATLNSVELAQAGGPGGLAVGGGGFGGFRYGRPDSWQDAMITSAGFMILFACGFIGLPITFVLLPVSRRRAKVRWAHIGRVWTYSLFIPFTVLYVSVLLFAASIWVPGLDMPAQFLIGAMSIVGSWLLLAAFWIFAIRNYLKMPNALLIVIIMSVLSVLVAFSLAFWVGTLIFQPRL